MCLLLLRLVPRLHGDLPSEAQYSRFQLRDVGRDSRGRVLPTEAQYSRFQLCDFGSDSRVGFALGYGLDALVDHPHLLQFRKFSCSNLPCAPRVETQQYILRVSHLLGEEIDVALGLRLFVARLVAIGGIVGRIEEVGIVWLFSLFHRRVPFRLLRRSVHVASTGTFDFGEVLLEAGDDRREVVDGEYRLLLEECVAYARGRVTVMRRPYVVGDWTVLG